MYSGIVKIFVLSILTIGDNTACAFDAESHTLVRRAAGEAPLDITVDLLIVCDKEFYEYFHRDYRKVFDYWAAYMWDVNMRFKSLSKVNISFRVTQLVIISQTVNQPFVEETRNSNGSASLLAMIYKFSEWVYTHETSLNNFDIAVLISGAAMNDTSSTYAWLNGACTKDHNNKMHQSVISMSFSKGLGFLCGKLEAALARSLGAPSDADTEFYQGCKYGSYLMASQSCGKMRHFFSRCSDDAIAKYVTSDSADCLKSRKNVGHDELKTMSQITYPPSLDEQCKMITRDTRSVADEQEEDYCDLTYCAFTNNRGLADLKFLQPLDNSPCGNGKFCFRGRCLPQSVRLRNVGTGKCLQSNSRFSSSDHPGLQNCRPFSTPLDGFMILSKGSNGTLFSTAYSNMDGSENSDKCLTVDVHEENLQYVKCDSIDAIWIGWDAISVENSGGEFLLRHRFTKLYAIGQSDYSVKLGKILDVNNKWMRWKIHERTTSPLKWFNVTDTGNDTANLPTNKPPGTTRMTEVTEITSRSISITQTPSSNELPEEASISPSVGTNFGDMSSNPIFGTTEYSNDAVISPKSFIDNSNVYDNTHHGTGSVSLGIFFGILTGALAMYVFLHYWRKRQPSSTSNEDTQCAVSYSNESYRTEIL